MEAFWPGPLTLLLAPQPTLAWDLPGSAPLAVRMPLHPLALALLSASGPMVVTTANLSGMPAPTGIDDALEQLGDGVSLALDAGDLAGDPALPAQHGRRRHRRAAGGDPAGRRDAAGAWARICPRRDRMAARRARRVSATHGTGPATRGRCMNSTPFWGPDFDQLTEEDPEIASIVLSELDRLRSGLQLIASENFTSPAVLAALGSTLSNKYAEGYPGRRYYGGCAEVDKAETISIERAKALFGAEHANLQPHSGASANIAAYGAFVKPGETVLAMSLPHGGHLTHSPR